VEWRPVVRAGGNQRRAGLQKNLSNLRAVVGGGAVKRYPAISVRKVRVTAAGKPGANCFNVIIYYCLNERVWHWMNSF
jgi:hypothetical protein